MKKRSTITNKSKKKINRAVVGQVSKVSLVKSHDAVLKVSSVAVCMQVDRYPLLEGIGSLGNVSGGYICFGKYMRGNYIHDLRRDWERVGKCLSESIKEFR